MLQWIGFVAEVALLLDRAEARAARGDSEAAWGLDYHATQLAEAFVSGYLIELDPGNSYAGF